MMKKTVFFGFSSNVGRDWSRGRPAGVPSIYSSGSLTLYLARSEGHERYFWL